LRNVSIAIDEYVLFEVLEMVRRAGYFIALAAVLFGLPLIIMLIALNALWAAVLTVCIRRMIQRAALLPRIGGFVSRLRSFVRANRAELARSGTYAGSEIFIYNYPYFVVPLLFGLGAPPIILDTSFKVFRGGSTVFGAVCDILVPRQTSAERFFWPLSFSLLLSASVIRSLRRDGATDFRSMRREKSRYRPWA